MNIEKNLSFSPEEVSAEWLEPAFESSGLYF